MKRLLLFVFISLLFANAFVYSLLLWPGHCSSLEHLALKEPRGQKVFAFLVQRIFSPYWFPQEATDPLSLVPSNTVLLLDFRHAKALGQALHNTALGQQVASINWPLILDRLDIKEEFRQPFEQAKESLSNLLTHPLSQELLGHRTVFALIPTLETQEDTILEQFLLLVQPLEASEYHHILLLLSQDAASHVYHGMTVYQVELSPQHRLYAAALGQGFTLSLSQTLVEASIERFLGHKIFKKTAPSHELQQQSWDAFALYVDLVGLHALLGAEEGYSTAQSLLLLHQKARAAEHLHSVLRFLPGVIGPLQEKLAPIAPIQDRSFAKMPAKLLLYFWSNWLEPKAWWDLYAEQSQEAAVGRVTAWLEKQTGMELEAFLGLFGNELALNIADISTAGFFPVPQLCFTLEVQERKPLEGFIEGLLKGLPVKREKVAEVPVVSLLAAQGLMQPSYAFVEDLLFLADSKEQLMDILDEQGQKLHADPSFQALHWDMSQPANIFLFARMAGLVEGMKELAAWFGTMISIRDQAAGAKSKILVDQVLSPLLEGLRTCEALGLRGFIHADTLVLDLALVPAEVEAP